MRGTLLIARRELSAYLKSPLGYIVAAAALLLEGVLFQAFALGAGPKLSAEVLLKFYDFTAPVSMGVALILSMRLVAGERETATLVLLKTSPVRDEEIIVGKFLAALALIVLITAATVYMPLLIFVNGKVSVGHIFVGYCGVLLIAAASLSVGLFASAIAGSQIVAVIVGAAILGTLWALFLVARVTEPPLSDIVSALNIYPINQKPFMTGVLRLENVFYYIAVAYFFLLAATHTLKARRWR
jgi:ABC-2 type transport system permease protein